LSTALTLRNLTFEDKAFLFMKNNLQQEKKKPLSPRVTLPQLAGILQASLSRNKGHLVESRTKATGYLQTIEDKPLDGLETSSSSEWL
jgi:hypothetical protein